MQSHLNPRALHWRDFGVIKSSLVFLPECWETLIFAMEGFGFAIASPLEANYHLAEFRHLILSCTQFFILNSEQQILIVNGRKP